MKRSISFRPTLLALVLATNFPVAHAAVPKDMLVIGKAADPQTLDPAVTIDNNDWTVTYPSYQRLVQHKTDGDKGSTDVEGDLASSWKASDDQKEWTFTLKDNAKFADGTPVTAEAVKLSFERLLKIGQGPAEAFPKDLKIDAPDEHTVKFTLSQPFAPFLYTLANDGASIINPAVLKEHAADDARGFLAQNTAGSGPFMLKSWQKGQQLVLVPNPHYPGNKPNFKRVSVKIIGESASRRLQLSRGDIDIADALPVLTAPAHPYTRLLLDSLPAIDKPLEEEWALRKTDLPGNRTLPQGCFFYERCPLATHGCEVRQSLTIREDGREILCWRAL
ncbi:oligopeptide/dipeptide ABC transporter ATP-binding protein [Escherichia coli]